MVSKRNSRPSITHPFTLFLVVLSLMLFGLDMFYLHAAADWRGQVCSSPQWPPHPPSPSPITLNKCGHSRWWVSPVYEIATCFFSPPSWQAVGTLARRALLLYFQPLTLPHGSLWIIRSKHTMLLYGAPGRTGSACALSQKKKKKRGSCARSIINLSRTVVPAVLQTYGGNSQLIDNIIISHSRGQRAKVPDENVTHKIRHQVVKLDTFVGVI